MFSADYSLSEPSSSTDHRHNLQAQHHPSMIHPTIVSFSSTFAFKIQKNLAHSSSLHAQLIYKNGNPLTINPLYKTLFTHQLQSLCKAKLTQIKHTYKIPQSYSLNSIPFSTLTIRKFDHCSVQTIINEKSRILIEFSESAPMMEQIQLSEKDLAEKFLFFLSQINPSLSTLLQRLGLIKASFKQKMKNHREIILSKNVFKKIIRNQNYPEVESTIFQTQALSVQNRNGVFEKLTVVREQRLNQNEMIFKRGGYFNIVKRKLVVQKINDKIPILQYKNLAEKKLSRRKRPNTIYNYQGKIPKELKLLECLSSLSLYELNFFAKYYFLNISNKVNSQSDEMIDELSQKDTLSTMSEQIQATTVADVIYMDFYEENLEEYLNRSGKLSVLQIIYLVRQILQSVQSLHKVGIVHRDIKPANFMIETLPNGQIKTKLIDFGESSHITSNYDQTQILGFTIPYAPIECTYQCKEGYNSKEIDLWSLGVVIYKLVTGRMPVTYSKFFKSDIKYEWPTSLAFFIPQYGQSRWAILENMIITLALMFLKVHPRERLTIQKGLAILDGIQELARHFTYQL